jgi:BolA protein
MRRSDTIRQTLQSALDPVRLDIVDESDQHAGHAGAHPEGETHFRVTIVAESFDGLSRIERHRKVNALLATELAGALHALALKTLTPGEDTG